jgi:hypothetical protein
MRRNSCPHGEHMLGPLGRFLEHRSVADPSFLDARVAPKLNEELVGQRIVRLPSVESCATVLGDLPRSFIDEVYGGVVDV